MANEHLRTGIRLLDLTRVLTGPTCTRLFAERGADVIKVEAAPHGEMARAIGRLRNERSRHLIQKNPKSRGFFRFPACSSRPPITQPICRTQPHYWASTMRKFCTNG